MTDKLDKAALRLELRKLYDDSPEAFEQIIEQLQGMAVADATMGPDPNGIGPFEGTAAYLDWVLPPIKIVRGKLRSLRTAAWRCSFPSTDVVTVVEKILLTKRRGAGGAMATPWDMSISKSI